MEGKGQYRAPNGDWYDGEYSSNRKHGKGTYHFASGERRMGTWLDGKKHGPATFHHARPTTKQPVKEKWERGQRQ
jgi:hypothetical protein